MPTDDERRAVARRLRAYLDTPAPWHLADVVSDVLRDDGDYDRIQHLADLIEPSDHIGGSDKMVDRDALLALADEMDEVAQSRWQAGHKGIAINDADRAARIREALGVVS